MKKTYYLFSVSLLILSFSIPLSAVSAQDSGTYPGKLEIKFSPEVKQAIQIQSTGELMTSGFEDVDNLLLSIGTTSVRQLIPTDPRFAERHQKWGLDRWYLISFDADQNPEEVSLSLKSNSRIEDAGPVYRKQIARTTVIDPPFLDRLSAAAGLHAAFDDPSYSVQWFLNNTGQEDGTSGVDISAEAAWAIETGSPDVIVQVIDSGIQTDHPDLQNRLWVNPVPGPENGYDGDIHGWNHASNNSIINDTDGHGTHVSGLIAAENNNGIGISSIAGGSGPADGVRIMTSMTFDDAGDAIGGFAAALVYGADNGAVISNNSWGYTDPDVFEASVLDAIDYFIENAGYNEHGVVTGPMAGGVVVVASGNNNSSALYYPGAYGPVLNVGATNNRDRKAWYSNYGAHVDVSAPGGETFFENDPRGMLSTIPGSGYENYQGTSMAAPVVSGIAALLVSHQDTPEAEDVWNQIVDSAVGFADMQPEYENLMGSGRANAFQALTFDPNVEPVPDPELSPYVATVSASENFVNVGNLSENGWVRTNNSTNPNLQWTQGNATVFPSHSGPETNSYASVNFQSISSGSGTISNWLITPELELFNGAELSFYSRASAGNFPDRLEVRLSTSGSSTDVGATPESTGNFDRVLLTINPNLEIGGYPTGWTQYTITLDDLNGIENGRIAFRYFVTNGGPTGTNSNYIGVDTFEFNGQAIAYNLPGNTEGWRMLSVPADETTIGELTQGIWTQGFTGSSFPDTGFITVYFWDETANSFVPATDAGQQPGAHRSVLVYVFENDEYGVPGGSFPKPVLISRAADFNPRSISLSNETEGWNMLGNIYADDIDLSVAIEGQDFSGITGIIYLWDQDANGGNGAYLTYDVSNHGAGGHAFDGEIPIGASFWVEADDISPEFNFRPGMLVNTGTGTRPYPTKTPYIRFMVEKGALSGSTAFTFMDNPSGKGARFLQPLSNRNLNLFSLHNDNPMAVHYVDYDLLYQDEIRIPVALSTTESGEATLRANFSEQFPDHLRIVLYDHVTNKSYDLREVSEFSFLLDENSGKRLADNKNPLIPAHPGYKVTQQEKSGSRFELLVTPMSTSVPENKELPERLALYQNYPNPFNPTTQIRYELPETGPVSLTVYTITGQRVATLVNEVIPAGMHTVTFDAFNLSSGVYIYRLQTQSERLVRSMTLVK